MLLPASYANGFAPRDGRPLYPELWRGCVGAWNPGLGVSGLTLRDQSGFQNNGTLTGGPTWAASGGKYSLSFDGSNDFVAVNLPKRCAGSQAAISMCCWVNLNAGYHKVFDTGDHDPSVGGGIIWYAATQSLGGGSQIAIAGTYPTYGGPYITANRWRHIAFTYSALQIRFFLSGLPVGSFVVARDPNFSGSIWKIGGSGGAETTNGLIGEFTSFTRVLSDSEIRLLATRRGIAYEMAPRRRSSSAVTTNRRRRIIIGGNR